MSALQQFLKTRFADGGFSTEDTLASLLPLFRQVHETHEAGKVAPFDGIETLQVEGVRVWFPDALRQPATGNLPHIQKLIAAGRGPVEVIGTDKHLYESGQLTHKPSLDVASRDDLPDRPVFVPGYVCWEQLHEHHDPATDIFCLGQLLASVSLNLDFNEPVDVQRFAKHRRNLFAINESIHPVIARVIVRMTEPDRNQRAQELPRLIAALENYRHQELEISIDPAEIDGFQSRDLKGKQQILLDRLQTRLFEITRRNRLLNFGSSLQAVNLTQASVPLSFDYKNIRDDQILIADERFQKQIAEGKGVSLDKFLNFAEAIYLPGVLDGIIRQARKDLAEYGFAQLRLVLCMLNWSNLKVKPFEQFTSPLVLLPVNLHKQRGVRDSYTLEPVSQEAEINPVVRYLFRQWYDIELPETVDLQASGLSPLFDFMSRAISASEPAVEIKQIDRPQIRILHSLARRRLERYQRRARISGRGTRSFMNVDYSYDPANFHPLGIRLFSGLIRQQETNPAAIMQSQPKPRHFIMPGDPDEDQTTGAGEQETERPFFEMSQGNDANPYNWTFDLCNVSLANFRYRKMSLVRDYERLVAEQPRNPAFESVFSLAPRPSVEPPPVLPIADRYDVVPCDPTQAQAIAQARQGDSNIIQGPPGTGKSQTITNLIADFAARGKRVLFVCEKRAAIDVVFARLRQVGLGPFCCLIHDSQADKKSFVMDLRDTYESFMQQPPKRDMVKSNRTVCSNALLSSLQPLDAFASAMCNTTFQAGIPTSQLLERAIELRDQMPAMDALQLEQLPAWRSWHEGRTAIDTALESLKHQQPEQILARHPLRHLAPALADESSPHQVVNQGLQQSQDALDRLANSLGTDESLSMEVLSIAQLRQLIEYCQTIKLLTDSGITCLINPASEMSRLFEQSCVPLHEQQRLLDEQRAVNSAWRVRIAQRDLPATIDAANTLAKKWAPFIRPSWWRLRSVLNRSYDFASHPVRPGWVAVLTNLQREYEAVEALTREDTSVAAQFRWKGACKELVAKIEQTRRDSITYPDWLKSIHGSIIADSMGDATGATIGRVAQCDEWVNALRRHLDDFLTGYETQTIDQLQHELGTIRESIGMLPDYLVFLKQLVAVPDDVRLALQRMDMAPVQIEAATAANTLDQIQRERREFGDFDQSVRQAAVQALATSQKQWMSVNAEHIQQQVQRRFLENVHLAGSTGSGLQDEQKRFQKSYNAGRKVLEHEFSKQMRYMSIRDLVSNESGLVIRDLKPIWLMSPLSVSDTLPLGDGDFDVVIFDEASQITLESAVPSLFRAGQAIVVGDEQQLPPTSFFATRSENDESEISFEEDGELIAYDLESNSLLNHAARNLPSTLLGWHYRSRDEALISFSNWSFYNGRLMTIPEENILRPSSDPLLADSAESAIENAGALDDRPVSFHFMEHGLYQKRSNRAEAEYIAQLVGQALKSGDNKTLGVIAFSEAQQSEIEDAIDRLAEQDLEFSRLLEAEMVREDDGQFVGLLVKNLENIQGDERDIVFLSICYGPDKAGRMLMNFGPINQSGGEKRLNVAFSRAKHHMAVVSSVRHGAITNTHNVGANCLRNYLRYSEAVSDGDAAGASAVLQSLAPPLDGGSTKQAVPSILQSIAKRLATHEFQVDFNIGSSAFRCDLGIRREGDLQYRLGILVDTGDYYLRNSDTIDRELGRPRLLEVFGWNVKHVLMQDWYNKPEVVVNEIVAACQNNKV